MTMKSIVAGACLGVAVDIIEPCGFVFSDARFKRSAMDYLAAATFVRHPSWEKYLRARESGRLILLTTRATLTYERFSFAPDDTLLLGRESSPSVVDFPLKVIADCWDHPLEMPRPK